MLDFSTFGETRRRRRRRLFFRAFRYLAFLGVLFASVLAAYEVGISQMTAEFERLEARTEQLQELSRRLNERVAAAQQVAERAEKQRAEIEQAFRREVPQGIRKDFLDRIDRRLSEGIPPDRLGFVIDEVQRETNCAEETQTKRIPLQTPIATTPISAISFAGDRITITGSGESSRNEAGQPEAWFDPNKPVELRFLTVAGELETARGLLPLTHAMVLGDHEHHFLAKPSTDRGFVEITMETCPYP